MGANCAALQNSTANLKLLKKITF